MKTVIYNVIKRTGSVVTLTTGSGIVETEVDLKDHDFKLLKKGVIIEATENAKGVIQLTKPIYIIKRGSSDKVLVTSNLPAAEKKAKSPVAKATNSARTPDFDTRRKF